MHNRCNIVYAIHFHITRYIVSKSLQGMYVKMQEVLMQRNLNKRKVEIVDIVCEKFVKVILLKALNETAENFMPRRWLFSGKAKISSSNSCIFVYKNGSILSFSSNIFTLIASSKLKRHSSDAFPWTSFSLSQSPAFQ